MSIPNSDNTDPVPVTQQPDWAQGVTMSYVHTTDLFSSRTMHEQRSRQRLLAVARLSYQVTGLTLAEALAAMQAAEIEARRTCIVPFWTEGTILVTSISADACTIGVDPRTDFFAAGQFVYLDDGTTQDFRQIASVSERILTLVTDGAAPAFGAGARIYPARRCRRLPEDEMMNHDDLISHDLNLQYETIE